MVMLQFLLEKKRFLKRVRVHFHANSGLIVANNASIINGSASSDRLENEVVLKATA
jgi:hypothetical protein